MIVKPHHFWVSTCLLTLIVLACLGLKQRIGPPRPVTIAPAPQAPSAAPPSAPLATQVAKHAQLPVADLAEIRFRRKFRILVPADVLASERDGTIDEDTARRLKLIQLFADEQFLLPTFLPVPRWQDLVPALNAGQGDLIGAHMEIGELRKRGTPFTVPVGDINEVLVGRLGDDIRRVGDLNGREIALHARSSFWPRLRELQYQAPRLKVRVIADSVDSESILEDIANMKVDLAVLDYGERELGAAPWQSLRAIPRFSSTTRLAFGVHENNKEMKQALNDFLTREQLVHRDSRRRTDDLDKIAKHGVLRVLTRNNDASYFLWRGRPLGFEYELIRRFAEQQKLSLEMILAPSHDALLPELLKGSADIIATNLVPTPAARSQGVAFTRAYRRTQKLVITHANDNTVRSAEHLSGRTLTLRHASPSWSYAHQLIGQGVAVKINTLPETVRDEEIITGVASGLYESTITDAYAIKAALTSSDEVHSAFALDEQESVSWAVRKSNSRLLKALNDFLDAEYRQTFYNIIHKRYFQNTRLRRARLDERISDTIDPAALSPYDDIVREQAKKYGFDWPLIVAIMFTESRFDPNVVSWAGAKGLMQVMPTTAQRFGISDLTNPTTSIIAGVRMLSWLFHRLEEDLSIQDRTWFTLASYNAGLGHLLDARRLCRKLGLDPNRWFDNVEIAMRLLEQPRYYRASRHGYVRGLEPVNYVRDIRELYNAYKSLKNP